MEKKVSTFTKSEQLFAKSAYNTLSSYIIGPNVETILENFSSSESSFIWMKSIKKSYFC